MPPVPEIVKLREVPLAKIDEFLVSTARKGVTGMNRSAVLLEPATTEKLCVMGVAAE
jgi:hypothetical protein